MRGATNRELFAFMGEGAIDVFDETSQSLQNGEMKLLMGRVKDGLQEHIQGDYILTDDKAPVELLGMDVIDSLIGHELSYYKDLFKREGIKGIINELS